MRKAPVAQRIEHEPPELGAGVRVSPGAFLMPGEFIAKKEIQAEGEEIPRRNEEA